MKIAASEALPYQEVQQPGAHGVRVRWLVGEADGAPNFAMRQFEIAPGGCTPHHSHPYEHEVYVLAGEGLVLDAGQPRPLRAGDVVYVAPDDVHQFRNTGAVPMRFLCLVPHAASRLPANLQPECQAGGAAP